MRRRSTRWGRSPATSPTRRSCSRRSPAPIPAMPPPPRIRSRPSTASTARCAGCGSGCRGSTSSRGCSPPSRPRCGRRCACSRASGPSSSPSPFRTPSTPWPPTTSSPPRRRPPTSPATTACYGLRVPAASLGEMYEATRAAGFGAEVTRRIMLGTYVLSKGYYDAWYLKAQQVRTLIRRDFEAAFARCDALVTPVAPTTAFRRGERLADPLTMYLSDIFTISVNLAGLPALVLPCGVDEAGLPIGLQIVGRPFDEPTVLRTAAAYEGATDWHARRPPG